MTILFYFSPPSNHLHPLQVKNCDSNSRLVVDEDDTGIFRIERVNNRPENAFIHNNEYDKFCELTENE